jgi:pyridinium-3,5-biscarboxylic acid mononucleotide synthase
MTHAANHSHDLRRLLEALVSGDLGLEDALQKLRLLQVTQLGEFARLDVNRDLRKGVPEVIYAPRKREAELEMIVRHFLAEKGVALVSRLEPARAENLRQALTGEGQAAGLPGAAVERGGGATAPAVSLDAGGGESVTAPGPQSLTFTYSQEAETLAVYTPAYRPPEPRGCVGLLTAGTSDIPVAEEAALVITHMGCRVERGYDTGVAGVHRLLEPLTRMIQSGAEIGRAHV